MSFTDFLSQTPFIGSLFDSSQGNAQDALAKNQELYGNIQSPDFSQYTPEQYQWQQNYDPQKAQATTVADDPSVRNAQLSALSQMAGLSQNGLSDVDQAGFQNARDIGNQMLQGSNAATLQNAQARGVGGSGLEFAMHEMGNQAGAQAAQQAGLQQSADSARQRALYTQAYSGALSGVRGQDFNQNSTNANILNNFNMANTNTANQAQQYNIAGAQGVANQNVTNANAAQQYNNGLKQQTFSDSMQKAGGQAAANTGVAQGYAAEDAANTSGRNANQKFISDMYGATMNGMGGAAKGAAAG